ncbi:hypothetical protein ACOME3_007172 [Neoechinorhynchus agilis]
MANLQSSLNLEANVGTNSLAIVYAFLVVSAALLPDPMIKTLGLKWTIAICQVTYFLYVLANIHPIGGLMYPAAILLGLGAAPLWTSQSTYLTQIGNIYAQHTNNLPDVMVTRFFGLFFMCFQTSQIWGNLISYFVLNSGISFNASEVVYDNCGGDYSPATVNLTGGQNAVDSKTRNILIGVYVALIAVSMLLIIFLLDQRKKPTNETMKETLLKSVKLVKTTVIHLKNPNQLLLIPLTMWNGVEQSFIGAQFTQGVVTCAYGIQTIGLVFICFGVFDASSSFISGRLIKFIPRRFLFLIAAILNLIVLIVLITWIPKEGQAYIPYILIALWAVSDAIWLTQVNAFYGMMFKDNMEAAFSNYRLWESLGFVIAYAYTPFIKVKHSAIFLICLLVTGLIGFGVADFQRSKKSENG